VIKVKKETYLREKVHWLKEKFANYLDRAGIIIQILNRMYMDGKNMQIKF
jgi:hypothetical protein